MLTQTAVHRLVSVPGATPPPSMPRAGAMSAPAHGGFVVPNTSAPAALVASSPQLPPHPSTHPLLATQAEIPAQAAKPDRRGVWALIGLAFVCALAGVAFAMGIFQSKQEPNKRLASGDVRSSVTANASPAPGTVDAGLLDASVNAKESAAQGVAISASSAPSGATILPPAPPTGTTSSSAKRKNPGPGSTKHTGTYDPLKEL
jgi:hypothetical protein